MTRPGRLCRGPVGALRVVLKEGQAESGEEAQDGYAAEAADAGLVLVQADVQPLMAGGLDAPLAAAQAQDLRRAELIGWTAGDQVGAGRGGFALFGAGANEEDQLGRPGQSQLPRGDLAHDDPALDLPTAILLTPTADFSEGAT